MVQLRLFASVREVAGTAAVDLPGSTVADVIDAARQRFGPDFAEIADSCRVWVNGDQATPETPVGDADEVALLPPVSGGAV